MAITDQMQNKETYRPKKAWCKYANKMHNGL